MEDFYSDQKIKKAIILAGGQKTRLNPLDNYCPSWMLPFLNRPLIEYTIDFLKKNGIEEISISISENDEIPDKFKEDNFFGIKTHFHVEDKPRGTAGAIKDLEGFIGKENFIVINSNIFIEDLNLSKAIEFYNKMRVAAVVGIHKDDRSKNARESVNITPDSKIRGSYIIHSSIDRRSPWRSSGIYIFNPVVLKSIDRNSYMDIKEQLIPALQKKSLNVSAYEMEGFFQSIDSLNDYIRVQRDILLENRTNSLYLENKEEVAERVWAGKDVKISPKAYLLGPVVIGDSCRIEDHSQIIGPAVIGNRCQISQGVLFRESILGDDISLSKQSKIEYSIIFKGTDVPTNTNIKNMLVINGMRIGDLNLLPSDYNIKGIVDSSRFSSITGNRRKVYNALKRIMDIAFSASGIVLLSPLFLLIAIAIKIGSPGPACYIQKRCGIKGKPFDMIKFRTMYTDAEKLHEELIPKQDTDGPIFKMMNDPRTTGVGRFLRSTNLDEIPQLINILKGEMSLVGPRPLIMDEMKFSPSWRDTRLKVKPGMTGLWQIQGRREASFHDWIRYDIYYVKNQSLWLDIKILFKTIKFVLKLNHGAFI